MRTCSNLFKQYTLYHHGVRQLILHYAYPKRYIWEDYGNLFWTVLMESYRHHWAPARLHQGNLHTNKAAGGRRQDPPPSTPVHLTSCWCFPYAGHQLVWPSWRLHYFDCPVGSYIDVINLKIATVHSVCHSNQILQNSEKGTFFSISM